MENTTIVTPTDVINVTQSSKSNTYNSQEELNVVEYTRSPKLTNYYHMSTINQNDSIVRTAQKIIWAGFGVICLGILFSLFGKVDTAWITTISGIITEIISGVVFSFVTQSNKSKQKYFNQLAMAEEGDKLIKIIETLDKEAKEKLFEKIVDNYCELRRQSQ